MRRAAVLAAAALVAVVAGCDYGDADFTWQCAGSMDLRGIDEEGTKEVLVRLSEDWRTRSMDMEIGESETTTVDLPAATEDGFDVEFLVGHDLDNIQGDPKPGPYCNDLYGQTVIDQTLTATGGSATITLYGADYERDVRADLVLEDVTFDDDETKVTDFSLEDAPVGHES